MAETFRVTFDTPVAVHCVYDADLTVCRNREAWPEAAACPEGCVALIDAENTVIAYVPDVVALVNPERRLPEMIAEILNAAAGGCRLTGEGDEE